MLLCVAPFAAAQSDNHILFVPSGGNCGLENWSKAEKPILDELRTLYDVLEIRVQSNRQNKECSSIQLKTILSQNPDVSVIHLGKTTSNETPGIHLWMNKGRARTYYHFPVTPWMDEGALSFAILNMSEEISASRQFQSLATPQPPKEETTPPPSSPDEENPRHLVFLGVGGSLMGIPDFGIFGGLNGHLTWRPFTYLSFTLRGAGTITQREISIRDYSMYTKLAMGQGWMNLEFTNSSVVTPLLGAGGGFVLVNMKGNQVATPDEMPDSDKTYIGYLGGQFALRVQLASVIFFNTGIQVGLQLPTVEVQFPDGDSAHLDRVLWEAFIGIEVLLRGRTQK